MGATGVRSSTCRCCISSAVTTKRSTTPSARGCRYSKAGRKASTRSFAACCRCRRPRRTGWRTRNSPARWRTSCSAKARASRATSMSYANIVRSRRKNEGGRMRLTGKTAIVTGAGSGFGAGIAKRFADEGAKVIVADINAQAGERVAREVGGKFMHADVTKGGDWAKLVAGAGAELDIIVNNAGWTHRNKPYLEVTEAEFDRVYAVNVKSIYLSAIHAVPVFRKRGGGCFVNIASTAGIRPRPGLTVYNSSKGAVITMSKSMAGEFGKDRIRVNCVNPVFSPETALSADFAGGSVSEEAKARFLATIPLGRFSTPLDVANACLYLASDEAEFISGVCIEVDGARCV